MIDRRVLVRGGAVRLLEAVPETPDRDSAPPVLLLPSGWGRAAEYRPILPDLGRRYRAIAPDYPGFGQSDEVPGIEGTADLAAWAAELIKALGIVAPVHVVGFSMGGWVALHLATGYPEMVLSLTLVATSGSSISGLRIINPARMTFREIVDQFYYRSEVKKRIRETRLGPEETQEVYRSSRAFARLADRGGIEANMGERLKAIRCPVLVVSGEHDRIVPRAFQEDLKTRLPNAELVVIPDTGHVLIAEEPEGFMDVLLPFLDRQS